MIVMKWMQYAVDMKLNVKLIRKETNANEIKSYRPIIVVSLISKHLEFV